MSFSVIIPSRDFGNLIHCVDAIRKKDPIAASAIVVVDDGIPWKATEIDSAMVVPGAKPFIFARNCNMGIRAADIKNSMGDIILLNDDTMLETPCGFEILSQVSQSHPDYGLISAVTNLAGNPRQQPHQGKDAGLREELRTVAFVCVYIPRATLDRVGPLDERFTAYGWEDNDYCRRVRQAGLKIGIFDGCFVDHASLKSSFRGMPRVAGDIAAGREIYKHKWGDAN